MIANDLYPLHVVCLPCYRQWITLDGEPPRAGGSPERNCELCGAATNGSIHIINRNFQRLIEKRALLEEEVGP